MVSGVLEEMGSVSSGISPDTTIFIPYETGVKYITGQNISPTITVISADVNRVDTVIENVKTVLADSYANAEFTISDSSKIQRHPTASAYRDGSDCVHCRGNRHYERAICVREGEDE